MLIFSILSLLLSNAVNLRRDKSILYSRAAIIIMVYCTIIALNGLDVSFLEKGLGVFSGLFSVTIITHSIQIFIFIISGIILTLTAFYPRKVWQHQSSSITATIFGLAHTSNTNILSKMSNCYKIPEYPLIMLFIISGASLLISSIDIVSIFLSIELQSYGLYLLCTLYRNSESSTSAGLTYFLLGGLSSCFILLGTSLLYVTYGTTSLDGYYILTSIANMSSSEDLALKPLALNISLLIMLVGFLFKISAAPFHFWSPDVYDSIPTIVTTFVAIIAKISILSLLLEIVHFTNTVSTCSLDNSSDFNWTYGLLISTIASLIIGTVLGLTQARIKRLFAYSTISHLGFILLALSINSNQATQSFVFYLMQYTITNLNAFILLLAIGYSLYGYSNDSSFKDKYSALQDRNNSPIQYINQLKGFYQINPMLALSLMLTLFSFVGIPPLVGFFGKQMVLSAALDQGYVFIVLVAILTSVISAAYYLNIIKSLFFDSSDYVKVQNLVHSSSKDKSQMLTLRNVVLSNSLSITISVLTLTLLLFIANPTSWLSAVQIIALVLINP